MVEHWLHNSMVPGSNPSGDENFFFYHHIISLLHFLQVLAVPGGPPMVPRWRGSRIQLSTQVTLVSTKIFVQDFEIVSANDLNTSINQDSNNS